jgi:hypothetical protein
MPWPFTISHSWVVRLVGIARILATVSACRKVSPSSTQFIRMMLSTSELTLNRRENIESRGIGRVRGPSQEPRSDQGLERLRDLREVIPDVLGQTLADEESPRMTMEEQQQIEIARVPQAVNTIKKIPDSLWRHALCHHERGRQYPRPPSGGQRATKVLTVASLRAPRPRRQG